MTAADRSRFSLRLLFADPLRKLASIGLAIVLWHLLDNQITKQADVPLQLKTVASASHPGEKNKLLVTIDSERYFVAGFYDRKTGNPIQQVQLRLEGANILVDNLNENPGFRVTPEIEQTDEDKISVEFAVTDIRPIEPKFTPLFVKATLVPSSIRVDLIRNSNVELALAPERVRVNASPQTEARLQQDSAEFTPSSVILLGPADQIALIQNLAPCFYADVPDPRTEDATVQGTLQILDDPRLDRIRFFGGNPIIKIPVAVEFEKHVYTVPYLLDRLAVDEQVRDQFVATESEAEIEIDISNRLALALWNMNPTDRQRWFRSHARLWVRLPEEPSSEAAYVPEFVIVGHRYREGVDYRVTDLKLLTVKRTQ